MPEGPVVAAGLEAAVGLAEPGERVEGVGRVVRAGDEAREPFCEGVRALDGRDVRGYGVSSGVKRVGVGGAGVADGGDEEGVGFRSRREGGGGAHCGRSRWRCG